MVQGKRGGLSGLSPAAVRKRRRHRAFRLAGWSLLGLLVVAGASPWLVATYLIAPRHESIGPPPNGMRAENVTFRSASGATVHGWLMRGKQGGGAVALMHGVHGNRLNMVKRARWLGGLGYTVLLFDFQACGETDGQAVTFGKREAMDAQAAVQFLRTQAPSEKIGVIAVSMGGAASLMADPPLPIDALVLESVYPSISEAIHDRLARLVGDGGAACLSPLLTVQMAPRLGFAPSAVCPIDHVARLHMPKLFLAGSLDQHTTLKESRALYEAAAPPKQLWIVKGAAHVNLYDFQQTEYTRRVGGFLNRHLRTSPARSGTGSTSPARPVPALPPAPHNPRNAA